MSIRLMAARITANKLLKCLEEMKQEKIGMQVVDKIVEERFTNPYHAYIQRAFGFDISRLD